MPKISRMGEREIGGEGQKSIGEVEKVLSNRVLLQLAG